MNDRSNAREWSERAQELTQDKHLREQVERIMGPLRLIQGAKDASPFEEVVHNVAQLVATLETRPELQQTANFGGVMVVRGPMQGYSILLHATDVFVMHLGTDAFDEEGSTHGRWHKAQEYWRAGQEAKS